MDIPRKDAARKRLIRRIAIGVVVLAAIPAITIGLSRLKPAAPGIDRSTVWIDAVKRGPIVLEVRGLGTLVPEETMLIPPTTDGRVQRILFRSDRPVHGLDRRGEARSDRAGGAVPGHAGARGDHAHPGHHGRQGAAHPD